MAIALERAPAAPRPWLRASRVLLVAAGSMFCHGVTGFGRPARRMWFRATREGVLRRAISEAATAHLLADAAVGQARRSLPRRATHPVA